MTIIHDSESESMSALDTALEKREELQRTNSKGRTANVGFTFMKEENKSLKSSQSIQSFNQGKSPEFFKGSLLTPSGRLTNKQE